MSRQDLRKRLLPRLEILYGPRAGECLDKIMARIDATRVDALPDERAANGLAANGPIWDQRDVVLITYGDQVRFDGPEGKKGGPRSPRSPRSPLLALERFLAEAGLKGLINTIHLLPCFPWSSDDGFSVIDYRQIDPSLGDWADVDRLGRDYRLMFDLVLNHISRRSRWFEEYLAGREPYRRFFIEVDPASDTATDLAADLAAVVRPRSLPLLAEVATASGPRHVWTTFSDDQIDLNYAEPDVLVEMVDVLLLYLRHGARIVRLDAIAYLWKQLGTPCIHLPQTHQVVKLLRDVAEELSPGSIILTETNVPHKENVSYFGDSDEAQMVYQFSLAPLLLEALLAGDGRLLMDWLKAIPPTPPATTVLNFTASHDGIGVRPLEGLMPPDRFKNLIDAVRVRGGQVSTKRGPDGSDSPYELNISYFSALAAPDELDELRGREIQIARFLASQAVMLSLVGIPAVYFHSLVATCNNMKGVAETARPRSINRQKFGLGQLRAILAHEEAPARVLSSYRRLLSIRIAQPAFHPDATQAAIDLGRRELVTFLRETSPHSFEQQKILVIANLAPGPQTIDLPSETGYPSGADLLAEDPGKGLKHLTLKPYQIAWLQVYK